MSTERRSLDRVTLVPLLPLLAVPLLALVTPAAAALGSRPGDGELVAAAYVGALGLMFLAGVLTLLASPVLWLAGLLAGRRTLLCLGLACADALAAVGLFGWFFIESFKGAKLMF